MPKRIKVKIVGNGTVVDPYRVDLPTYMIDCERDKDGNPVWGDEMEGHAKNSMDVEKKVCYVLVPDDEVDEQGKLNEKRIREKYKEGWSEFEAKDVEVEEV